MRLAVALLLVALAALACAPASVPTSAPLRSETAPTTAPTPSAFVEPAPESAGPAADPEPVPTAAPLARCATRTVGATTLDTLCLDRLDLRIDRALGEDDVRLIAGQVQEDVLAVEREFAWRLRATPVVEVFATSAGYAEGLREDFGYGAAAAEWVAENSVAFFEPSLRLIAVNWTAVGDRRPVAAFRHELTHLVTLEACAPRCDLVPAWLNEGQARLAEAMMPGAEWRLVRVRYEAASMAATESLIPLGRLVTQGQWNALVDWEGYYKYQQAARATELLRADIGGEQPIARIYERIRRGQDVATAYLALTGRSFDSFARGLRERMLAAAPAGPGIVLTPGPTGRGAGYLLYGFAPEAKVTVTIATRRFEEIAEIGVSPQGAHFGTLDDLYPPGSYTIAVGSAPGLVAFVDKPGGRRTREVYEPRGQ